MGFFLCKAGGLLNASQPWSIRMVLSSTSTEGALQPVWDASILAMWQQAALTTYFPAATTLTYTQTSTADATFHQTTVTKSTHNIAGTSASKSLPYHVSEVLTLRSAYTPRWGRGRIYMPPMADNAADTVAGYIMLAAAAAALVSGWQAFFTSLGATGTAQILHRKATLNGTRAAYSTDPVVTHDISNLFVTQRRRGSKVVPTRSTV